MVNQNTGGVVTGGAAVDQAMQYLQLLNQLQFQQADITGYYNGEPTFARQQFEAQWALTMQQFEMEKSAQAQQAAYQMQSLRQQGAAGQAQAQALRAETALKQAEFAFMKESWAKEFELKQQYFGLDVAKLDLSKKAQADQHYIDLQNLELQRQALGQDAYQFAKTLEFQYEQLAASKSGPQDWVQYAYVRANQPGPANKGKVPKPTGAVAGTPDEYMPPPMPPQEQQPPGGGGGAPPPGGQPPAGHSGDNFQHAPGAIPNQPKVDPNAWTAPVLGRTPQGDWSRPEDLVWAQKMNAEDAKAKEQGWGESGSNYDVFGNEIMTDRFGTAGYREGFGGIDTAAGAQPNPWTQRFNEQNPFVAGGQTADPFRYAEQMFQLGYGPGYAGGGVYERSKNLRDKRKRRRRPEQVSPRWRAEPERYPPEDKRLPRRGEIPGQEPEWQDLNSSPLTGKLADYEGEVPLEGTPEWDEFLLEAVKQREGILGKRPRARGGRYGTGGVYAPFYAQEEENDVVNLALLPKKKKFASGGVAGIDVNRGKAYNEQFKKGGPKDLPRSAKMGGNWWDAKGGTSKVGGAVNFPPGYSSANSWGFSTPEGGVGFMLKDPFGPRPKQSKAMKTRKAQLAMLLKNPDISEEARARLEAIRDRVMAVHAYGEGGVIPKKAKRPRQGVSTVNQPVTPSYLNIGKKNLPNEPHFAAGGSYGAPSRWKKPGWGKPSTGYTNPIGKPPAGFKPPWGKPPTNLKPPMGRPPGGWNRPPNDWMPFDPREQEGFPDTGPRRPPGARPPEQAGMKDDSQFLGGSGALGVDWMDQLQAAGWTPIDKKMPPSMWRSPAGERVDLSPFISPNWTPLKANAQHSPYSRGANGGVYPHFATGGAMSSSGSFASSSPAPRPEKPKKPHAPNQQQQNQQPSQDHPVPPGVSTNPNPAMPVSPGNAPRPPGTVTSPGAGWNPTSRPPSWSPTTPGMPMPTPSPIGAPYPMPTGPVTMEPPVAMPSQQPHSLDDVYGYAANGGVYPHFASGGLFAGGGWGGGVGDRPPRPQPTTTAAPAAPPAGGMPTAPNPFPTSNLASNFMGGTQNTTATNPYAAQNAALGGTPAATTPAATTPASTLNPYQQWLQSQWPVKPPGQSATSKSFWGGEEPDFSGMTQMERDAAIMNQMGANAQAHGGGQPTVVDKNGNAVVGAGNANLPSMPDVNTLWNTYSGNYGWGVTTDPATGQPIYTGVDPNEQVYFNEWKKRQQGSYYDAATGQWVTGTYTPPPPEEPPVEEPPPDTSPGGPNNPYNLPVSSDGTWPWGGTSGNLPAGWGIMGGQPHVKLRDPNGVVWAYNDASQQWTIESGNPQPQPQPGTNPNPVGQHPNTPKPGPDYIWIPYVGWRKDPMQNYDRGPAQYNYNVPDRWAYGGVQRFADGGAMQDLMYRLPPGATPPFFGGNPANAFSQGFGGGRPTTEPWAGGPGASAPGGGWAGGFGGGKPTNEPWANGPGGGGGAFGAGQQRLRDMLMRMAQNAQRNRGQRGQGAPGRPPSMPPRPPPFGGLNPPSLPPKPPGGGGISPWDPMPPIDYPVGGPYAGGGTYPFESGRSGPAIVGDSRPGQRGVNNEVVLRGDGTYEVVGTPGRPEGEMTMMAEGDTVIPYRDIPQKYKIPDSVLGQAANGGVAHFATGGSLTGGTEYSRYAPWKQKQMTGGTASVPNWDKPDYGTASNPRPGQTFDPVTGAETTPPPATPATETPAAQPNAQGQWPNPTYTQQGRQVTVKGVPWPNANGGFASGGYLYGKEAVQNMPFIQGLQSMVGPTGRMLNNPEWDLSHIPMEVNVNQIAHWLPTALAQAKSLYEQAYGMSFDDILAASGRASPGSMGGRFGIARYGQ